MDLEFEDFYEEAFEEKWPRDVKVDETKEKLIGFFNTRKSDVFYLRQLEVYFEKEFFHWITAKAVSELIEEGRLREYKTPLQKGITLRFIFHKSHRYYKRQVKKKVEVVREFSGSRIARAYGEQAEILFSNALMKRGFVIEGEDANEFRGKKWTKTEHNLDFIISKDNVVYGCEVKNKLEYIPNDELNIKLDMCNYLGIRPLFIMRYAPKTYINQIYGQGGFSLIFETQIYPLGHEQLVEKIKKILELPADCPRAIPKGIIDRFMKWHKKLVNSRVNSRAAKQNPS